MGKRSFPPKWHLLSRRSARSHKRVLEVNAAEKRLTRPISRRTLLKRSSVGTLVAAPSSAWSLAWVSQRPASAAPAGARSATGSINMYLIASQLDAQVRAVCPDIDGVQVGNPQDRTTWGIWFQPSATSAQRAAANTVLARFVPAAESR